MTTEELDRLDRLAAEELMGWFYENGKWITVLATTEGYKVPIVHRFTYKWQPTRNIAQAWEVLEKIKPFYFQLKRHEDGKWNCSITPTIDHSGTSIMSLDPEASVALAIVRACLKAKGVNA